METDILLDIEQELQLQPAPLGKRFLNLLLDIIGIAVLAFFAGMLSGFANDAGSPDAYGNEGNPLLENLIFYLCYLAYYTVLEGLTKGRSLGKLATGTVAVKSDGSAITWKDALLRSLCRLVPFETLSAFGQAPWHDKWTKTMVVKKLR